METLDRLRHWAARHERWLWTVFTVTCLITFAPFVGRHLHHLWQRPHYQFFPAMLLSLGALIWTRRHEATCLFESPGGGPLILRVNPGLVLIALITLAAAFLLDSPWIGFLSAFTLLLMFARNYAYLPAWLWPLLILLPLPLGKDVELMGLLQRVSSHGASALLDVAGIRHVMSGNVLELPDRQFFVEEACSGIGSVFLLLASAAVFVVWKRLRLVVAVPLLISAVGWAVAANMLRIFAVATSHAWNGPDLSAGLQHEAVGTLTFLAALVMMVLTAQLLLFVLDPLSVAAGGTTFRERFGQLGHISLLQVWNRLTTMDEDYLTSRTETTGISGIRVSRGVLCLALCPVLGASIVYQGWQTSRPWRSSAANSVAPEPLSPGPAFESLRQDQFTQALPTARLVDFTHQIHSSPEDAETQGTWSSVWQFQFPGTSVRISVDGPFDSWHDLRTCYRGQGCRVVDTRTLAFTETPAGIPAVVQTQLYHELQGHSLLMFAEIGQQGGVLTAPAQAGLQGLESSLTDRLLRPGQSKQYVWQLQMLIPSAGPLDPAELSYWADHFDHLLREILAHWRTHR